MLKRLLIKNFGLIDQAELLFAPGFTVFTGETGAGKSMLIDALSLGLGARGGVGFVKKGAKFATIEATFELCGSHPLRTQLVDMGIELEDDLLFLRRQVQAEGKTRCFACGISITQGQMVAIGTTLADIHGQRDQQLLLEPKHHTRLLDSFSHKEKVNKSLVVEQAYQVWRKSADALADLEAKALRRIHEMDLLTAYVNELSGLSPQKGEESLLAAERQKLMQSEKVLEGLNQGLALLESSSPSTTLAKLERVLSFEQAPFPELEAFMTQLDLASRQVAEVETGLSAVAANLRADPQRLEEVDERLHGLRALARKHQCTCDGLIDKYTQLQQELHTLENISHSMADLQKQTQKTRHVFEKACADLTQQRQKSAAKLSASVQEELKKLKMPSAQFDVRLEPLDPENWGTTGAERVAFYVQMNPGTAFSPLEKAASGGEISRLMLALKVVFFVGLPQQTLVFDEIDTGVGGAVAEAMGRCLQALAKKHQVFAITHLPQVAALGAAHMKIAKQAQSTTSQTHVLPLEGEERQNEIARMLSGAELTTAAKQAAKSLLAGHNQRT